MRSREQFLDEYARSHQNPLNQMIHLICVPAIFWATLALLWLVPVGRVLPGIPEWLVPALNGATLLMPLAAVFYLRMGLGSLVTGAVWTLLSLALNQLILSAGLPLVWIAATVWVFAWAVQFYGHHVEGAKPSFADDLLFLLVGPLFVQQKLRRLVTSGSLWPRSG